MSPEVLHRFNFNECKETRTWQTIAKQGSEKFRTGGISNVPGDLKSQWMVWGCWEDHPCLGQLEGVQDGDSMCYVYNEKEEAWYPWDTRSGIEQHSACPA
jgi:hypothetical protein